MSLSLERQTRPSLDEQSYLERLRQPINLIDLSSYTMGNKTLEKEVLQLFKHQSLFYLRRLQQAKSQESWLAALRVIAASARSVGAWRLENMANAALHYRWRRRLGERNRYIELVTEQIELANRFIDRLP